jgi:hypothetical protein
MRHDAGRIEGLHCGQRLDPASRRIDARGTALQQAVDEAQADAAIRASDERD